MSQLCFLCSKPASQTCSDCKLVQYCSESHLKTHRPLDECLPFRVGFVEGKGRVVIAARDIKAGEAVITEHPLVKGPGNKTPPSCLQCLKKLESDTTCTVCGWSAMKRVKEGNCINLSVRFQQGPQKKEFQTFCHIKKLVIHLIMQQYLS